MDTRDKAYQWIDEHKDEMISLWKEMVTIDSGIGVREGGMAMGNLCAGILEKLGFSIRRVPYEKCGDTIIGERGDMTKPFTILMGHMDTVFFKGEPEKRPFTIKDGKAYGPGVLDMKGGVTILLSTLQDFMKQDLKIFHARSFWMPMKNRPTHFPMHRKSFREKRKEPNVPSILKPALPTIVWWYSVKDAGVSSSKLSDAGAM